MIKEWFIYLNEVFGYIDDSENYNIINKKRSELIKLYRMYSDEEKEKLHNMLRDIINIPDSGTLWLMSFLMPIIDATFVIQLLCNIIQCRDFDIFKRNSIEFQLACLDHIGFTYEDKFKIHELVLKKYKEIVLDDYLYINPNERNSDNIVIFTEQILNISHSPTRRVLEYIWFLQDKMNKNVYLIVMPSINTLSYYEWYDRKSINYIDELNGKTLFQYKNVNIKICQILFNSDNLHNIQNVIRDIYNLKPMFVFSMGVVAPVPDIISKFTTVVSDDMSISYPISNAQILLKYGFDRNDTIENIIHSKHQKLIFIQPFINLEPVKQHIEKEQLGIPKENFAIALVGNRLDEDISDEFILFLENLADTDSRIFYVVIGYMNGYLMLFKGLEERKRASYLGRQDDLPSVLGAMDLYLNPNRKGGGVSALMSLKAETPVVTLGKCDVAFNVGKDFTCSNELEETNVIMKYITSKEFYKEQVVKAINRINEISDVDSNEMKILEKIHDIIYNEEKSYE